MCFCAPYLLQDVFLQLILFGFCTIKKKHVYYIYLFFQPSARGDPPVDDCNCLYPRRCFLGSTSEDSSNLEKKLSTTSELYM